MKTLSEDLFSHIFIRLPAKQVAQARCVSKSWNNLLSRPSFIKSHLHRSTHHNNEILFAFSNLLPFDPKPFTAHPSQSPHLEVELTNLIKLPNNFQLRYDSGNIIGSVNGLICFEYGDSGVIHIWNPSLSAVLTLPPYSMPSGYQTMTIWFRFGFDPKNDDYKVVKIVLTSFGNDLHFVREWQQVEVYSMRKGSWDFITERIPSHIEYVCGGEDAVCVDGHDGHLHWLALTDELVETLVAYDLCAETFRVIPIPDSVQGQRDGRLSNSLGVLGGKVCVVSCVMDGECEVWVMEEYGVGESWVKNSVFSGFSGDIMPYGFTLRNEFLFGVSRHGFGLYDPVAAKTKIFKIRGEPYTTRKIVDYVDSLVWPRAR